MKEKINTNLNWLTIIYLYIKAKYIIIEVYKNFPNDGSKNE